MRCLLCGGNLQDPWSEGDPWFCNPRSGGCGASIRGPLPVTATRWCERCKAYKEQPHEHANEPPSLFDIVEAEVEKLIEPSYPTKLYDGNPPAEPKDRAGTSRAAASSIQTTANTVRGHVKEFIVGSAMGATDDEVEQRLGLRHQTASARRRELVLLGDIRDSGQRRKTRSGRYAVVWVSA